LVCNNVVYLAFEVVDFQILWRRLLACVCLSFKKMILFWKNLEIFFMDFQKKSKSILCLFTI
jgi:hypothetical protein